MVKAQSGKTVGRKRKAGANNSEQHDSQVNCHLFLNLKITPSHLQDRDKFFLNRRLKGHVQPLAAGLGS